MIQDKQFSREVVGKAMPYRVYTPKNYDAEPETRFPLVVFLHGAGERGTDLQGVTRHGPLHEVATGRNSLS